MLVEVRRGRHTWRMSYEEFEERIRSGEIAAHTLVRFEVVTGDRFVPAGQLELFQALADPRPMAFRRRLSRPVVPWMTAVLVGVQLRVYLWSFVPGVGRFLQEHLTNWAPAVLERGESWRLLTYGFLHLGFTHLLFNICFLAYAGYHVERALGSASLLALFLFSVFAGGLLSMVTLPEQASLGASAGDFGLLAAAVVLGWKHWDSIPPRARRHYGWALVPYPMVSFLVGLLAPNVDNWSHLGGLVGGALLVTVAEPELLARRRGADRRLRWGAVAAMLLVGGWLWSQGARHVPLATVDHGDWRVARPAYWKEGWTLTGNRGWFARTRNASLEAVETTWPRPVGPDQAADSLLGRIGRGPRPPEVLLREPVEVDGVPGRHLVVRFELSGRLLRADALVLTRGVYEYRVVFVSDERWAGRWAPLVRRIEDRLHVGELAELARARRKAAADPRSWRAACALGEALYRAGRPDEALSAFRRSLELGPANRCALVGLLQVHATTRPARGVEAARRALEEAGDDPAVVVAAVDVLAAARERAAAIAALEAAWRRHPGDVELRKARLRWGLSVEPPEPGDGAGDGGRAGGSGPGGGGLPGEPAAGRSLAPLAPAPRAGGDAPPE